MNLDDLSGFEGHAGELPTEEKAAESAGAELEHLMRSSYGKGAGKVSAAFLGDDGLICILKDLEFQRGEKFLIERGESDAVLATRVCFQRVSEPQRRAIVEHATGRRVHDTKAMTSIDPPLSVELFLFGPPD